MEYRTSSLRVNCNYSRGTARSIFDIRRERSHRQNHERSDLSHLISIATEERSPMVFADRPMLFADWLTNFARRKAPQHRRSYFAARFLEYPAVRVCPPGMEAQESRQAVRREDPAPLQENVFLL